MGRHEPYYTVPDHVKFVEDMEKAGIETGLYHGRYFWHGPAVRTGYDGPSFQEVIRATSVEVQWDSMGLGKIVYPVTGDSKLKDAVDPNEED